MIWNFEWQTSRRVGAHWGANQFSRGASAPMVELPQLANWAWAFFIMKSLYHFSEMVVPRNLNDHCLHSAVHDGEWGECWGVSLPPEVHLCCFVCVELLVVIMTSPDSQWFDLLSVCRLDEADDWKQSWTQRLIKLIYLQINSCSIFTKLLTNVSIRIFQKQCSHKCRPFFFTFNKAVDQHSPAICLAAWPYPWHSPLAHIALCICCIKPVLWEHFFKIVIWRGCQTDK